MPVIHHCMVLSIPAFLCTLLVHVLSTYIRGTFLMLTNNTYKYLYVHVHASLTCNYVLLYI